jgi:hypothetical protein
MGSSMLAGTTQGQGDEASPPAACAPGGGEEVAAFWLLCPPDRIEVSACATAAIDSVVYLRRWSWLAGGEELACNDDTCGAQAHLGPLDITEPGVYWVVVDTKGPSGMYDVQVSVSR